MFTKPDSKCLLMSTSGDGFIESGDLKWLDIQQKPAPKLLSPTCL